MTSQIQKYHIKNLDCANCAAKIEAGVKELPGVHFASLNFATSTLHLDADNLSVVQSLVDEIEPGVTLHEFEQPEAELDSRVKWQVATLGAAIVLFILGLIFRARLASTPYSWAEIAVFGGAYALSGWSVLFQAGRNLWRRNWFDETFLMSIATLGAVAIQEYPEAVGVMLFYEIGEFVQELSVRRSRRSIQALMEVRPDFANLKTNGEIRQVSPEEVNVNDVIVIRPGERVPLDGVVLNGASQLDTSALTGESMPRPAEVGDEVLSGSINKSSLLELRVTRPFLDSTIARMMELVQNAAGRKARTEKFITRFANYYTPFVVLAALLVAIVPPLVIPGATFPQWIYRALVLLVISCPCALMISIPLGYFGGIGKASRNGILVKGSNFLDVLANVKTVVFDKTGTLTQGSFQVSDVTPHNGYSPTDLLRYAAIAETHSNHPIAQSIVAAYGDEVEISQVDSFEELSGFGVQAQVDGNTILVGNDALLHEKDIPHAIGCCETPGTVVHVAVNGEQVGHLVVADELKPDAIEAVEQLHKSGVERILMLTGDRTDVAAQIAAQLNLDDYRAELLPEDKVAAVESLMADAHAGKLAFVGDGINDAPVIARSDVGIAMGALGSDAAIETADVVLMTDAPSKVAEAIQLGKRTRKIIWQNIAMALGIKGIFILLGVFGVASMWEAVFADVGVAILAVFNATRVLK